MGTMGGHAHLVITAVPTVLPQVRASRLRALAVTSSKRLSAIPELPTVAESGVPAFESVQYYAMFARQGTVPAVVERLYFEIRRAAESRNVMAALAQEGAELSVGGPQALTEFRRIETARWGEVIRRANFTLE